VRLSPLGTPATIGLIVPTADVEKRWTWGRGWNKIDKEKKVLGENLSQFHFVVLKTHTT
jgi:hypothetical protein